MESGYGRCNGMEFKLMCTMLDHIHANMTVKFSENLGFINDLGEPKGLHKDVLSSQADLTMNSLFLRGFWRFQGYPFYRDSVRIITLKELKHSENRFAPVYDLRFCVCLILFCIASTVALKYILESSLSSAALDFLRMFVSSSTLNQPRYWTSRVLLITLIVTFFIISSFVQSRLSALETTPIRKSTIDSAEDLLKSNLTTFGVVLSLNELIWHKEIIERYHVVTDIKECINQLLKGKHVGCIDYESFLWYYIQESTIFHISTDNLVERGLAYTYAEDFPLRYKLNWILLKLNEGGFVNFLLDLEKLRYNHTKYDVVEIPDIEKLVFGFYVLLSGWTLASFVFFVEIIGLKCRRKLLTFWNRVCYN